jgi:2-desacetyl-2-hydroxyethyl bacteriochlorophyllide A dehydrogenase
MIRHKLTIPEPHRAVWVEDDITDPGPGEVLVRTTRTLISTGTELTAYTGQFPADSVWAGMIKYPQPRIGYSNVGRVVAVGPGVSGLAVGQRVASWGPHATLHLASPQRPGSSLKGLPPIPDGVSDDQAVFRGLGQTVMHGIRLAQISLGEAVVVVGAGLLGQLAVQYARMCGAYPLIAVDLSRQRLEMAGVHGATHAIPGGRGELLGEIRSATKGRMADVVFEVTGNEQVIPSAFRMARRLGRVVLLGSPRGKVEVDFHDEVHTLGLQIIGAHVSTQPDAETLSGPWTPQRNDELFFDLVLGGRLALDDLVTHRYDWRDAPEAYRMLAEDRTRAMGVVLEKWPTLPPAAG